VWVWLLGEGWVRAQGGIGGGAAVFWGWFWGLAKVFFYFFGAGL